jgi:hypothetical protein
MKKLRYILTTAALLSCGFTISHAQTLDEIIKKHLEAIGGAANWKKVNSIVTKGSLHADNQEYAYYNTVLNKKGELKEFSAGGMTAWELVTPKKAWAYVPQMGLETHFEPIPDVMLNRFIGDLDLQGPLIDTKAKGIKTTYSGKGDFEGTMCYKIDISYPDGRKEIIYIDTVHFYRLGSGSTVEEDGVVKEQHSAIFSNFKKLPEGIVVPMNFNIGDGPVTLEEVFINKPVDEHIFIPQDKQQYKHY